MRALIVSCLSCVVLCAASVGSYVARLIDYGLGLISSAAGPPAFAFAGSAPTLSGAQTFRDPHVERHEAGTSRRAAARGI